MRNLKAVLVVLILMSFSMIIAQPAGPPPQKMDMVKELKAKLQLTDEQVKKVETIFANNKKKIDSLFQKKNEDREADRKKMDEMRKSTNSEIEKILTKEQKAKFKEMTEKMENRMPPPPPDGMMNKEGGMRQPGGNQFGMRDKMPMQQQGCGCPCCQQQRMMPPPPPREGGEMMPPPGDSPRDDSSL
jgi:hypothetical protein